MKNRTPVAADQRSPIPPFTPVARRYRHDGWTAERQRAFIAALAETGSVTSAAARINMAKEGAYQLRLSPDGASFRAAWTAALDYGVQQLADLAIDRARDGVAVPIFHKGEQVGERRWYDNRLLQFVLRHHMPDRYGTQLRGGTRSPETIAREAAEACPVCSAARDESPEAAEAWLDEAMKRYLLKLNQEREERRAGRWLAADFYLRQLTHLELILDMGARAGAMLDRFTVDPETGKALYASPISAVLAERRATFWAMTDDPPRPPLRLPRVLPDASIGSGPSHPDRLRVRAACEARIAAAQNEWEATRSEESWAEWCADKGASWIP